jgi:isopenicillin-N N-acyltransferase-like protein
MTYQIPIINLAGTHYEIGYDHGSQLKDLIILFLDDITRVHQLNNSFIRVTKESLTSLCMRNFGFMQSFSPDLCEELRGIADGAGVSWQDILYLNCFLELEDLRAPALGGRILPQSLWGCTTFNVSAEAGADQRIYLGQTFDMEKYYKKFLCILRIRPKAGPEQLIVSMAGVLGLAGLNAAGVGLVINKLVATDARPGVIYPFIVRKALAAERIGDALGAVIFSPRATGMNYQLAGSGVNFCAETSAERYELLEMDGAIAHTNHWLGASMRKFEAANWLSHGGSMVRRQVAATFLKKHKGRITPELLREMTKEHTNYPRCICAHGFAGDDEKTAFHTIFAIVMDPAAGWMDLCPGNPCETAYMRHVITPT